jgi:hypothetical protein
MSFACPHVAAHPARIRAARPGLSVDAVKPSLPALTGASERAAEH